MTRHKNGVDDDFPLREEVEDFGGRRRRFVITCHTTPVGFTLRAEEEGAQGDGYVFGAYSETTTGAALWRLREKMYRALATRHITGAEGEYHATHDVVRGRITWDSEQGVALLVVDGIPLNGMQRTALRRAGGSAGVRMERAGVCPEG